MKGGQSDHKTKVVVRHLPPALSQAMLMERIDVAFADRYNWLSFRPGKISPKHQSHSRAYINFDRPEDIFEFAEFFNGHLFVNEKGIQFKAIVEYAPSQRVPKYSSKKDGREATVYKDPEYLEFLEFIAKPVENLPSAEIQLERREAERAGAPKDAPIITPLMDFVRQKRAAKSGSRRILSNRKHSRRAGANGIPNSSTSKRGSEKKSSAVYVMRAAKSTSGKVKSTYILKADATSAAGTKVLEDESGGSEITNVGKKKILLRKGKEKEISPVSDSMSKRQDITSDKNLHASTPLKQSQRREANGRIIRSILLNKDSRQSQSPGAQSEHQIPTLSVEKDKRPPRSSQVQFMSGDMNGDSDERVVGNDTGFPSDKQDKCTRNKDRPDRVVWTHLRRSNGSYASDESLSSSASHATHLGLESSQGNHEDSKVEMSSRNEVKCLRSSHSPSDNGSHKHFGRRGPSHMRDSDGSLVEGKPSKRSGASGYAAHEKQVWVQKSNSGS